MRETPLVPSPFPCHHRRMEIRDILGNIRDDHVIYADCGPCKRSFRLDVAKLIERLGPDCPTLDALRKVVCKECGGKLTTMRAYDSKIKVGW